MRPGARRLPCRAVATMAVLALVTACSTPGMPAPDTAEPGAAPLTQKLVSAERDLVVGNGSATPTVGIVYDIGGPQGHPMNRLAAEGAARATDELGVTILAREPASTGADRADLIDELAANGASLVIAVGYPFDDAIARIAPRHPGVDFALVDGFLPDLGRDDNVVALGFAEHEGAFLVGAAAALQSTTGRIGFIGGVEIPLIAAAEAGYVAGARTIDPEIEIDRVTLSTPPDFTGLTDPEGAFAAAQRMYAQGADVIHHAAQGSGAGVFEAAAAHSAASGEHVWAIGSGIDEYTTVAAELRAHLLTSMVKRIDVAVHDTIAAHLAGELTGGYQVLGVDTGGVDFATSGGFVEDIEHELRRLATEIAAERIVVPDGT